MNLNNDNNKIIAIVVGAVAALFFIGFVVRFIVLSQYGYAGPWIWFAIPAGGIGLVVLVLRLGLLANLFGGQNSGGSAFHWNNGVQAPPAAPAPASQRLQQLDQMRASGAISDSEYSVQRQQIIATM
jgi:hypothetical protein